MLPATAGLPCLSSNKIVLPLYTRVTVLTKVNAQLATQTVDSGRFVVLLTRRSRVTSTWSTRLSKRLLTHSSSSQCCSLRHAFHNSVPLTDLSAINGSTAQTNARSICHSCSRSSRSSHQWQTMFVRFTIQVRFCVTSTITDNPARLF